MDWQAAAAVFVLLTCVALWVLPAEDVNWRSQDMKRWRTWREWWRL